MRYHSSPSRTGEDVSVLVSCEVEKVVDLHKRFQEDSKILHKILELSARSALLMDLIVRASTYPLLDILLDEVQTVQLENPDC